MSADLARELMEAFAVDTGLAGDSSPRRYLWTDAFAVCNFLELHRRTGEGRYLDLALTLVDQVHHVLGRHRDDDPREGWIGGLPEAEGERHPTRGGLRIGKPLPERAPGEAFDPRLEWERDGQYFHYLTKWMHALERVAAETGLGTFHEWAVELAVVAHRGFFVGSAAAGSRHMVWKASIGLDRPLVPSTGHHDPLDALLTFLHLATGPTASPGDSETLAEPIADATALCLGSRWATEDSLGIGGLLTDVYRLGVLVGSRGVDERELLEQILADAGISLESFARSGSLDLPAEHRLPFRELGLAIGLHAVAALLGGVGVSRDLRAVLDGLCARLPLAARIEAFWREPAHRRATTWTGHRDINAVMLATCLAPRGFLGFE